MLYGKSRKRGINKRIFHNLVTLNIIDNSVNKGTGW